MSRILGPERIAMSASELMVDLDPPRSALAVCSHPDDPEFFTAGTFAKWADAGTACTYLICTDGAMGSWEPGSGRGLAEARKAEQEAAAAVTGAGTVLFLGHADGFLQNSLGLRRELVAVLREVCPDVVLTHDPWRRWRLHPDHRECGFAVCDAVATAREALAWPRVGPGPHRPDRLWLFESEAPDRYEDISSTLDRKLAALLEHRSQWPTTMGIAGEEDAVGRREFADRVGEWAARDGARAGLAGAESFREIEP